MAGTLVFVLPAVCYCDSARILRLANSVQPFGQNYGTCSLAIGTDRPAKILLRGPLLPKSQGFDLRALAQGCTELYDLYRLSQFPARLIASLVFRHGAAAGCARNGSLK